MGTSGKAEASVGKSEFTSAQIAQWKRQVAEQRDVLFRRNWKNRRQVLGLQSKEEYENFQFILEWYDESDEVIGRDRERNRLDRLIQYGVDVNAERDVQEKELAKALAKASR